MKEKPSQPERTHFQPTSTGETHFSLPLLDISENQDSDDTIKDFKLWTSADVAIVKEQALRPEKQEAFRLRSRAKKRPPTDSI